MTVETAELDLLRRAADGEPASWQALVARHEDRLRRLVALRLDQRMRGRVSPSDVVQEAYLEACRQLKRYLDDPRVPFYLWLRGIAGNKLRELHRRHLGARMREAGREVSLHHGGFPEATSAALAARLVGKLTRPSEAAVRAEMKVRLQEVLNTMDPIDREVLVLRHFEQLSPAEAAQVLGVAEKAAGMRYMRALRRLRTILTGLPGGPPEP